MDAIDDGVTEWRSSAWRMERDDDGGSRAERLGVVHSTMERRNGEARLGGWSGMLAVVALQEGALDLGRPQARAEAETIQSGPSRRGRLRSGFSAELIYKATHESEEIG